MEIDQIMERLRPVLDKEGVEMDVVGQSGPVLLVRARRVAPGAPVAFLIKAIAGTFRRYHPEIKEVSLEEYDPGAGKATAPSAEFDRVFRHRPPAMTAPSEIPGLDLSGEDRARAARALESAATIWAAQGVDRFTIHGLTEDAPLRASEKWLSLYRIHTSVHPSPQPGVWVVHLAGECQDPNCLEGLPQLVMPARVLLQTSPGVGDPDLG